MDTLEILALAGATLILAGAAAIYAVLRWLRRDDDRGVWTAAELAGIPRPAGRHRALGERAADHIGRGGWVPCHDEDEIPPNIRSITMEQPVVQRARVLAWEFGICRKPVAPPPRRLRRVQLELARRLRAAGVPTVLRPRVGGVVA